ncbi:transglutaminase domain-containing protein [Sporosarcina cyprini]|uniref:transglutaminase domain-containing protein n=1 Tax=Sporosarcina cyprini TaxID=2910523 RepID=UPI001EDFAA08|nr:transglutaminase-like domain-containing protein [Sporosarcina cyprini]MCG3088329.1 transglutaminase-like domain-containing protein [Sporosarcina cyprini]
MKKFYIAFVSLVSLFVLSACTSGFAITEEQKQGAAYEEAAKKKNDELEKEPVELSPYARKLGASLTQPIYREIAANGVVTVEGTIEQHEKLKGDYVVIDIGFNEGKELGDLVSHYVPIKDGMFKQDIKLFNGEGDYLVSVLIPSTILEESFDNMTAFSVFNVNPTTDHGIVYTPFAQAADLSLQAPDSRYVKGNEVFTLKGKVDTAENIMLVLFKGEQSWSHILSVKNGEFSYDVPLPYGKGVHGLTVYLPPENQEKYYQQGAVVYIDNQSDLTFEPIQNTTDERGVHFASPAKSGEEAGLTYRISGTIDKDDPLAKETTHLFIEIEKDNELAYSVIPIDNFTFDDQIYLRFGAGTYNVTVNVPEARGKELYYVNIAEFSVVSKDTEDQRNLLPSKGVQSDAPEIIALARELITDEMSDREKAKAVYEYTAKNISYDVKKWDDKINEWDDSALKTLQLKSGICGDYSYLAIALLRASGMEARYIVGTAFNGYTTDYHAWVEVKVDGKWLTMDPTWGSGYTSGNAFIPEYTEDYFDPTEELFKTHTRLEVRY